MSLFFDHMLFLSDSPREVQDHLAAVLRQRRRVRKHSRQKAAEFSGVPGPTLRRFETTGEISLRQFLMLCATYGDLGRAAGLFPEPGPATMDELLATHHKKT